MKFTGRIIIIGVNPNLIVPDVVLQKLFKQAGKAKGAIPVKGKLNGKNFIKYLVKYDGEWRLYLNGVMRKAGGIDVGDLAMVSIEYDEVPRNIPVHPKLHAAFLKNKKADAVFKQLSPSRQKEIVRYIHELKTNEALVRNIKKVIEHLNGNGAFAGRK